MSDGCTLWPDGDYGHCCEAHDAVYHRTRSWRQRWRADWRLFLCVRDQGRPVTAAVMLLGVLVLGPIYGLAKEWWGI